MLNENETFELLIFLNWTQSEENAAERAAYDDYVALGVATAISFTYPSAQS